MDALKRLIDSDAVARLRAHDATLFDTDAAGVKLAANSMGWTDLAARAPESYAILDRLALDVTQEGVTDVVLLGMGGSSLASLVIGEVLAEDGGVRLHVLDTTAPLTVGKAIAELDPARTLYVVASKSGGTIEPLSLYAIFREEADNELGRQAAGRRFIAITDPDTSLAALAVADGFRLTVSSPASVGGRFSAMTVFGLVTAALLGIDFRSLVERAAAMEAACSLPAADNPAAALCAFIADAQAAGRDKLTVVASPALASFGLWVEQLVAESLGKLGTGVIPVVELSDEMPLGYGSDRAVVVLRLEGNERLAEWVPKLAAASPVVELVLRDGFDIGAEFVRWEHAVALLGPLLGVNPFGQPNVQSAKDATAAALSGALATPPADHTTPDGTALTFAGALPVPAHAEPSLSTAVGHALGALRPHDFLCVLAYLPADDALLAPLHEAVPRVSAAMGHAVTLELGPRYLHSTGQLHKGGPDSGIFILVTTRDHADVPVPGRAWCLRDLHRAQAEGDLSTLTAAGRRVLRVDLPDAGLDSVTGLARALMDAAGVVWED